MILGHLVGKGMPTGLAAVVTGGLGDTAYTAAGTSRGNATLLGGGTSYVSICSSSGKGVALPACDPNSSCLVYNGTANTLYVYGQLGEAIQSGAANAKFVVNTQKSCMFTKMSSTLWSTNLSA